MDITIDNLTAGAARAEGVTVVIDVFRAYTFECWAYSRGAGRIYPLASLDGAMALKAAHPGWLLAGERHGRPREGFDFGNSPSQLEKADIAGRTIIHTTSAGTQGIEAAVHAERILPAALVNAAATAEYIRRLAPQRVSLVCMGFENTCPTEEDTLCAEYIRSLLLGEPMDVRAAIPSLRAGPGSRFFVPENQAFAPERDFELSTDIDRFPFALEICKDEQGRNYTKRVGL